jgi:hypothetical protein
MENSTTETFKTWAILELMGHRKLAGLVSEVMLFGVGMIRIDVPTPDGLEFITQHYSPSALYCLSPCTEAVARAFAVRNQPQPVTPWDLRTLPVESEKAFDASTYRRYRFDYANGSYEGEFSSLEEATEAANKRIPDGNNQVYLVNGGQDDDLPELVPEKAVEPGTPNDALIEASNDPDLPF